MGLALATGDILRGKYRLEQVLGRGGMGTVHLATHLVIGQRVAIKIVNPSPSEHEYVVARFLREARAAALLESEHVVRILDVDEVDDGTPFMVMEYLHGSDLGAILRNGGRLPLREAVGYVLQACEALAEAHAAGIVHRDLKPSNLFRAQTARKEPIIKLLDFGISKLSATGEDLSLTSTQAVIGSPLFMSPEQLLSSRDVDHRTDIWSIGVTLYQLAAGALPFEASSASALGAQIAAKAPRTLSTVLADVPRDFEAVVMRCLARAPEDRFADIVSLARALAPYGAEDVVTSVQRAAERGMRGRMAPSINEAPAPSVAFASGERWTQSRALGADSAASKMETGSRESRASPATLDPPNVTMTGPAPFASPPPTTIAPTPSASPPPPARRRLVVAIAALVVVAGVAALVFVMMSRHKRETENQSATTIAITTATATGTPSTKTTMSSSAAITSTAAPTPTKPAIRGAARTAKPAATWSKDPSELELK